jgi:hypothetical protein
VTLPPRALRANQSGSPRSCFAGVPARLRPIGASGDRSAHRLARRRFDVAARAIKVIKAMFDAVKRGTRSNWQGAISNSLVRTARFLNSPAPFHVAANSGFGAACERIWTAKNKGFCDFPSCSVGSLADGHKPKTATRISRAFNSRAFNMSRDRTVW